MSSSSLLSNCLICGKEVEEEKPIILSEYVDKLTRFKGAFQCFLGLLKVGGDEGNKGDRFVEEVFSALSSEPVECVRDKGGGGEGLVSDLGIPFCGRCEGALEEIRRLELAIEEMRKSQMSHALDLKASFVIGNKYIDRVGNWSTVRKELISCITDGPGSSLPLHLPSDSKRVPTVPRRNGKRKSTIEVDHGSDESKIDALSDDGMCSELSSTTSPAPSASKTMRPCFVVLKRLKTASSDLKTTEDQSSSPKRVERKSKLKAYQFLEKNVAALREDCRRPSGPSKASKRKNQQVDLEPVSNSKSSLEAKDSGHLNSDKSTTKGSAVPKKMTGEEKQVPLKGKKRRLRDDLANDFFSQIHANIFIYKYSIFKSIPEKGLSCQEPNCSFVSKIGTDSYATFEDVKHHVRNCHLIDPEDRHQKLMYFTLSRKCPLCIDEKVFTDGPSFRSHLFSTDHNGPCPFICQSCLKPVRPGVHGTTTILSCVYVPLYQLRHL